jgi:hypothetical protein
MAIPRLIAWAFGAIALLVALLLVTLLVIYRPSIEYAYVDIIDPGKGGGLVWWVAFVGLGVLGLAAIVVLRRSRRASR